MSAYPDLDMLLAKTARHIISGPLADQRKTWAVDQWLQMRPQMKRDQAERIYDEVEGSQRKKLEKPKKIYIYARKGKAA